MALLRMYRAPLRIYRALLRIYRAFLYVCLVRDSTFEKNICVALLRMYRALLYVYLGRDSTSELRAARGDHNGSYYVCIQGSFSEYAGLF